MIKSNITIMAAMVAVIIAGLLHSCEKESTHYAFEDYTEKEINSMTVDEAIEILGLPDMEPDSSLKRRSDTESLIQSNSISLLFDGGVGATYTVHKVREYEGFNIVNEEYFFNSASLGHFLADFGRLNSQLSDNRNIPLGISKLSPYLQAWGSTYDISLDTIYLDFWNSHGNWSYTPYYNPDNPNQTTFVEVNSTGWDEYLGVGSSAEQHNSFYIMVPTATTGTFKHIYLLNNTVHPPNPFSD